MNRLEGKVAIVTGGAKGLGQAMAERFANEGAKVIACDMMELQYEHPNVEFYKLNVTDVAGIDALKAYVVEKYGKVDILVNNAGITRDGMTHKIEENGQIFNISDGTYKWDVFLDEVIGDKLYTIII